MDMKARARATKKIQRVFNAYRAKQPGDRKLLAALKEGKLYELFVLSKVVTDLTSRGFSLTFVPSTAAPGTLKFKASPGMIKTSDAHFELRSPYLSGADYRLFLNIEFDTLGHHHTTFGWDNSRRHELDIVVTTASKGYPGHNEIALGVECKAVAKFTKDLLKEVLGVRREMALFTGQQQPSALTMIGARLPKGVAADPPSEFIVAYIDPKGSSYRLSPEVFGIEFEHWEP
ncbi:hypothetical protein [Aureimonas phyllosphaerae]|uniref:Uncharacterized protein n=1 Tax=Aureimonas phyllosphaerae TaxID=1166078 RepID=A0A7W6BXN5_9HYPH|nr:hypothetical protein [Aureimonas phyllosphaerae]MBB3937989.1 hypothetical protein [Aureimonas phyllosphaerae]MBB3961966.1 hypothetical protein [Aureimonas phyllosphaerae]SFF52905.1 hypothetical protein SAMN05216566_12235 [Aureimonas phyllosphaerae]